MSELDPGLPSSQLAAALDLAEAETQPRREPDPQRTRRRGLAAGEGAVPVAEQPDLPQALLDTVRLVINRYELRTNSTVPKWIAVTSPGNGESAETISRAFAAVLADEVGERTCWVDCSWLQTSTTQPARGLRRFAARLTRTAPTEGVATIPSDDEPDRAERADSVERTDDQRARLSPLRAERAGEALVTEPSDGVIFAPSISERLTELRFGPVPPAARNAMIRSAEFARLMATLDQRYSRVVFSIPSILTSPGALTVVSHADATVVTTRHRSTALSDVRMALSLMSPTPNLAVMVAGFRPSIPRLVRRMFGT